MRILLPLIKKKLFLLSFLVISSVIIATTIPFEFDKGKEPLTKETKELKKRKNSIQPDAAAVNTKTLFAASVNQVAPRSGIILGGTAVTISGSGFTPPNAIYTVKFDGVSATSVVRVSNSVITAVTPAHVAGTVSVTVGINGVETTTDNLFTYVCDDPSNSIFIESMGTIPSGPPVSITNHEAANGFDNDNYTMSGTGEIRGTPESTGYPGASGGANVFLTNIFGRDFQIEGINTSSYPNVQISFGIFKNLATSNGSDLNIEVSADGINYQALDFAPLPTGSTSTGWYYRVAGGPGVPITSNLRVRFRQNGSITQYRIDDVRLISSPPVTTQPASIVRCLGSSATFTVTVSGNDSTYQWRKNNIAINGANADSYTIPSVTNNDAGSYDVLITETCSGITTISNVAELLIDKTPPVVMVTGPVVNLGCNPSASAIAAALGSASASDNCGTPTLTQSDGAVQSTNCLRSQVRMFTAIDNTGQSTSVPRTVIWITDLTPPAFVGSFTPIQLGCNPSAGAMTAALGSAAASDACSAPTITNSDGAVFTSGCSRTQTRTFTAIDACGNFSTISRSVTWIVDMTRPVFIGDYSPVNMGCNTPPEPINQALGFATASDACSSPTLTLADGPILTSGCNRSQTRTFIARDACGNTSSVSRTVNWVVDQTPPDFGPPVDVTILLGCNPSSGEIEQALGSATATDNCGTPQVTFETTLITSSGCNRSQARVFRAIDACNNTRFFVRTVTWTVDLAPPVFTGNYSTVNLGCNPSTNSITAALDGATATDACGVPLITLSDGPVITSGCNLSQTRTFTARDACGNTSTSSRTITWIVDITPPEFIGNYVPITLLGCNPSFNVILDLLGTATATDACSTPTITTTDGPIILGCNSFMTRRFTAVDACGNTSSVMRMVFWTSDFNPPTLVITSTGSSGLGCNPSANDIVAALGTASASDDCGSPALTTTTGPVVINGCDRSQTRTFAAIDACGNISTASRTITWTVDITPPTLSVGSATVHLGCNPTVNAIESVLGTATATDACGAPTFLVSTSAVTVNGCNRSQTRTFTSIDACGNFTSASRTAIWVADPPPVFIGNYGTINLGCNPPAFSITAALDGATATDACGTPTLVFSDGNIVSNGCNRSQTRTFTAIDGCGNISTVSRTVNWFADNTPPVLTISGPANLGCNPDPAEIDAALGTATAFDACAATTLLTSTGAVVVNGCNRSQTRTFTSMDACGNFASASRTVTWIVDASPPAFIGSYLTINLGCNPVNPAGSLGGATATEACGVPTVTSVDEAIVSNGCNRSQIRTFRAFDACGNTSSVSRTVNWFTDNTPPVLTISGSGNLGCNPDPEDINAALGVASAFDGCATPTLLTNTGSVVINGCNRSQTRTFTSMDACGNFASASRTVTWIVDASPPAFIGSYITINLGCNPANPAGSLGGATATEACGVPTVTSVDEAIVSNGCNRSQTRTFRAFDACGNTSSVSRTVNWVADINPPVFIGDYSTVVLGPDPDPGDISAALDGAIASDACGTPILRFSDGPVISNGCDRSQTRTFTATDACGNFASISRTVVWTCGLTRVNPIYTNKFPKTSAFNVKAYPNPTEHQFTLYLENATDEKVQIVVYDALGRQVKMFEKASGNIPIRLGMDLKVGVYMVEVRQGDNRKTLKLVKQ
jgi:IPT/TIG domain/Secretion system C-terminal sorting domain